jgi:hypothetical protein
MQPLIVDIQAYDRHVIFDGQPAVPKKTAMTDRHRTGVIVGLQWQAVAGTFLGTGHGQWSLNSGQFQPISHL